MKHFFHIRYIMSLVWLGFVVAISFIESPLKFQARSVSLEIGLEIGKIVFGFLNKAEWCFISLIIGSFLLSGATRISWGVGIFLFIILLSQSFYLLPLLETRADLIIKGVNPPSSRVHFYYVGLEVIKVILLLIGSMYFIYREKLNEES